MLPPFGSDAVWRLLGVRCLGTALVLLVLSNTKAVPRHRTPRRRLHVDGCDRLIYSPPHQQIPGRKSFPLWRPASKTPAQRSLSNNSELAAESQSEGVVSISVPAFGLLDHKVNLDSRRTTCLPQKPLARRPNKRQVSPLRDCKR